MGEKTRGLEVECLNVQMFECLKMKCLNLMCVRDRRWGLGEKTCGLEVKMFECSDV